MYDKTKGYEMLNGNPALSKFFLIELRQQLFRIYEWHYIDCFDTCCMSWHSTQLRTDCITI